MNDYSFGNFVCALREEKGLTQADIAERLNVTPAAVSKWENGSSKPRVEVLFKLAEILDVRPEELMAGHHIKEENLDPEAVRSINERYEYLIKTDTHNTTNVKMLRLLAWIIDWNIVGFSVLILIVVAFSLLREQIANNNGWAVLLILLLILLFPITFILRDVIWGDYSIGKRITGLIVIDSQTGTRAKKHQRIFRNIFLMILQIDSIFMFVSGRSIGDRAAHTFVVMKKDFEKIPISNSRENMAKRINQYRSPQKSNKKKMLIGIVIVAGAFILYICIVLLVTNIALANQKNTEEYKLAYEYLTQSEEFKELNASEDDIRFTSYSVRTRTNGGLKEKTAEYMFTIGSLNNYYVIMHDDGDGWYVCSECSTSE